ncbi:hypothetical protein K438DRAFT_1791851 [Mycena galopus ATCC 62051]|nr:hypothetical protein K438DRAFT_1791851 [Mycena galopus ATCC 62051]
MNFLFCGTQTCAWQSDRQKFSAVETADPCVDLLNDIPNQTAILLQRGLFDHSSVSAAPLTISRACTRWPEKLVAAIQMVQIKKPSFDGPRGLRIGKFDLCDLNQALFFQLPSSQNYLFCAWDRRKDPSDSLSKPLASLSLELLATGWRPDNHPPRMHCAAGLLGFSQASPSAGRKMMNVELEHRHSSGITGFGCVECTARRLELPIFDVVTVDLIPRLHSTEMCDIIKMVKQMARIEVIFLSETRIENYPRSNGSRIKSKNEGKFGEESSDRLKAVILLGNNREGKTALADLYKNLYCRGFRDMRVRSRKDAAECLQLN